MKNAVSTIFKFFTQTCADILKKKKLFFTVKYLNIKVKKFHSMLVQKTNLILSDPKTNTNQKISSKNISQ